MKLQTRIEKAVNGDRNSRRWLANYFAGVSEDIPPYGDGREKELLAACAAFEIKPLRTWRDTAGALASHCRWLIERDEA